MARKRKENRNLFEQAHNNPIFMSCICIHITYKHFLDIRLAQKIYYISFIFQNNFSEYKIKLEKGKISGRIIYGPLLNICSDYDQYYLQNTIRTE